MSLLLVQTSPLTVTPSGQGKSVTVTECHSKRVYLFGRDVDTKQVQVTNKRSPRALHSFGQQRAQIIDILRSYSLEDLDDLRSYSEYIDHIQNSNRNQGSFSTNVVSLPIDAKREKEDFDLIPGRHGRDIGPHWLASEVTSHQNIQIPTWGSSKSQPLLNVTQEVSL